eukprot:753585-Hanusia_phi.AAC.8
MPIDISQEKQVRAYYGYLSRSGIFHSLEKVFFQDKGIRHADIMYYTNDNINKAIRRVMITSLDALMKKGDVLSFHLGPEYVNDIKDCHRSVGGIFEFHSRIMCLDIDVKRLDPKQLDPVYHLVAIDYMLRCFKKSFDCLDNRFNYLVCSSGKGWHVYIDTKSADKPIRYWDWKARVSVRNYISFQDFLEKDMGNEYMKLKAGYRWLPDCRLLHYGTPVLYPEQFEDWFNHHCLNKKVAINDTNQNRFLQSHGRVMSVLYHLSKFITEKTDKYNMQISRLLNCTSVSSIFSWLDSFRILAVSCGIENPFQEPMRVKGIIFYLCIQSVMEETGFIVDTGMDDVKHPLRAPFSIKFKEEKSYCLGAPSYDAYISIPLGDVDEALDSKEFIFKLKSVEAYANSGDKEDLPNILKQGLSAWNRFDKYRSSSSGPELF